MSIKAEKNENRNIINDAIIKDLSEAIHDMKSGEISIKVYNSKITQIDVTQKSRYDEVWFIEGGGGI